MKKHNLKRLIEHEKLLYIEVEQLRLSLYLHDASLLFEFFSAFYFAGQDIRRIFVKPSARQIPLLQAKKLSIASLVSKIKWLQFLSNTPYAWTIYLARAIKNATLSLKALRPVQSEPSRTTQGKRDQKSQNTKSFLIFGTTDSHDLQSRSVQIAHSLSKQYSVIYIEGVFNEGGRPGYKIIEQSPRFTAVRLTVKKSIHLNYQTPSPKETAFLKKSYKFLALSFKPSAYQAYIHHPFWALVFPFKNNSYLFDHADNFAQNQNAANHIIQSEKKTIKNARFITAPEKKLLRNKKGALIKNGVDWNMFKDTSKMIQTCDVGLCWIKKPVLGYIGTLDEKIDEKLLGHLARAFPSASIVLVGNTDYRPVIEVAEQYPNIFPVGKQLYTKLPLFLQSFDILISPFKYNKLTAAVHPELPLYLASGKPIVATALADCGTAKKAIYQPKTHSDWILAVAEALKEKKRSKKRSLRIAAAKRLTWKIPNISPPVLYTKVTL